MKITGSSNTAHRIPTVRKLRILGVLIGAGLLLWLPIEDTGDRWVLFFSATISALAAAQVWLRLLMRFGMQRYWLTLTGLLAGILITPLAFVLMALKTGMHGHQGPDFSGDQIIAVMVRTPLWMISGLIIGIGLDIFRQIKSNKPPGN